jgi:uncharacterized protein YndB with AHSA1/START domain
MPTQKDFKRRVRARMQKTGESYTAARHRLIATPGTSKPSIDRAKLAGMSDAAVRAKTGRTWAEWVSVLDEAGGTKLPHPAIAQHVASLGLTSWWAQTVTVGYERIRGLRERGQKRGGTYEASKSRTFSVPVSVLFDAFADVRLRRRWLPVNVSVRSVRPPRRMRMLWEDGTLVHLEFVSKSTKRSAVAVQHTKLVDRAALQHIKQTWTTHFDRLAAMLA